MSADLILYSPRELLVTREEMRTILEQGHYFVVFTDGEHRLLPDGLLCEEWLLASRSSDGLPGIVQALKQRDDSVLQFLSAKGQLVSCGLWASQIGDISEEAESLRARGQTRAVEALSKAKTKYHFNVSFRTTTASWKFFESSWRMLGGAVGGLLDDPQSGELTLVEKGTVTTLVRPRGCFAVAIQIIVSIARFARGFLRGLIRH